MKIAFREWLPALIGAFVMIAISIAYLAGNPDFKQPETEASLARD